MVYPDCRLHLHPLQLVVESVHPVVVSWREYSGYKSSHSTHFLSYTTSRRHTDNISCRRGSKQWLMAYSPPFAYLIDCLTVALVDHPEPLG